MIRKIEINDFLYKEALNRNYTELQSKILGSKLGNVEDFDLLLNMGLSDIPDLSSFSGLEDGITLMNKHINNNNHIALVVDYDSDGATSAYVLYDFITNIIGYSKDNISIIINSRKNGNGIGDNLLEEIYTLNNNKKINLVITADHGSANGININKMKNNGIEVIVTDHHMVPVEDNADNADAFINPQKDVDSPFKYISGCAVAFFTMVGYYHKYIQGNNEILHKYLPIVAVSTIGDSMRMDDPINRTLVRTGIYKMNTLEDPMWQAIKYVLDIPVFIDELTFGFNIVPAFNAASRMDMSNAVIDFLTANDYREHVLLFENLLAINNKRKEVQKKLVMEASFQADGLKDKMSLSMLIKDGLGLNGIISSHIGISEYKPTVTFIKTGDTLSGSGRAINENFNLNEAFKNIQESNPEVLLHSGGHKMAAGCKIAGDKFKEFKHLFEIEVKKQLDGTDTSKVYDVIEMEDHEHININMVNEINSISPYGIGYTRMLFSTTIKINKILFTGRRKEHMVMDVIKDDGTVINCFMFNSNNSKDNLEELNVGDVVKIVYTPNIDTFRGRISFRLTLERVIKV